VDETNVGNRDKALKDTYKGLPKLRYVIGIDPLSDPLTMLQSGICDFMVS
jgi:hypothetical protein